VLESAITRVTGSGLRPEDYIKTIQGSQGPAELRYRAHVAFRTAYDLMRNVEALRNRRKAVLYISSGYDFNPFAESRLRYQSEMFGSGMDDGSGNGDPFMTNRFQGNTFAEADLVRELAELTRAANRANATFYTIDPRGLVAGPDLDQNLENMAEWQNHIRETQDSLRVIAEQTGGIAVVNQNDFDRALKRIDAETSDYYVLGYYSSNPDPLKRTRKIEVKASRDGVEVWSRTSYTLRPLPAPQ
jgi:VWFA-related protein